MPTVVAQRPAQQFRHSGRSARARNASISVLTQASSVIVFLVLWQIAGSRFPYALSNPIDIARAAYSNFVPTVLPALTYTLTSFFVGLAISLMVGIPIGLAIGRSRLARIVFEPYINSLYSMPMIALFPILLLVFGITFDMRVAATILFAIFAIIINTAVGAIRVSQDLLDAGYSFNASKLRILLRIVIPGSLPYIFAGIRIGFAHGLIGAVVIEMMAGTNGIGYLLRYQIRILRVDGFFVCVFALGLFGVVATALLRRLEKWVTSPWSRSRLWRKAAGGMERAGRGRTDKTHVAAVDAAGDSAAPRRRGRMVRSSGGKKAPMRLRRMTDAVIRRRAGRVALRGLVLVALLVGWEFWASRVSRAVLVGPVEVSRELYRTMITGTEMWSSLWQSLTSLVIGFVLAVFIGILMGLMIGMSDTVANILNPYVNFLYALPHVVFIPIMVTWLGFGFTFSLAYIVISAVFPALVNTVHGVHAVDRKDLDVARSFCANRRLVLRRVLLPSTLPFMLAGARLSFSLSWIAVVVSEVLTTQRGLGGRIIRAGNDYQTAGMLAPVILITVIAVVILAVGTKYQWKLTPWFNPSANDGK